MKGKVGNPEYQNSRETNLLCNYGLTLKAYNELLEAQNFGCKICKAVVTDSIRSNLSVDHNHKTNHVRGLLCGNCNRLLGYAKENQTILLRAIQYLKGNLK